MGELRCPLMCRSEQEDTLSERWSRMSKWADNDLEAKVLAVLAAVPTQPNGHAFGRPFVSAYQLAIGLERSFPGLAVALGKPLGGSGAGQQDSLTQYVANELSKRIHADPQFPVEGAFLSNADAREITYSGPDGGDVKSSLVGSPFDLSLFRLR